MGGGSKSPRQAPPDPASKMMGQIAKEQWEKAKNLYGFAETGGAVPDWMINPILSAGNQGIQRGLADARQMIQEMAPGGAKERALADLATAKLAQQTALRAGTEQDLRGQALAELTGAQQSLFRGLTGMSQGYQAGQQAAFARQQADAQNQGNWLGLIGQLAQAGAVIWGAKG